MRKYVESMMSVLCGIPCPSEPSGQGLIMADTPRVVEMYAALDPAARGQAEGHQARFLKLMAHLGEVYTEAQVLIADVYGLMPADGDDDDLDDQDDDDPEPSVIAAALADGELSVFAGSTRTMLDAMLSELHKRGLPAPA